MEIKYRAEIDGLRAIAVLSVIIYHAEFSFGDGKLLPGGFLGVDVFFVISGFLITSLMMSEFHKTGTISITNFYKRRTRRLLPALLVVMLASMPFAWMYLLPEQLIDYAKSLISSLFFSSNFYWDQSLQEYGAESGLLKPFLHTWSLAVEEQYYIVFPLILLAIYKWCKSSAALPLAVVFILSLLFAEWVTPRDPSFSFYMLPSRFWELLAGGLLANFLHLHSQNNVLLGKTMPFIGLTLIIYSVVFTKFDSSHPGFVTLPPVIGTVLIIWFASGRDVVTRLLSSKMFVSVGLISYSLYLWHYPIFAFFRIEGMFDNSWGKYAAIVLTFILSIISCWYVENLFRSSKFIQNRTVIALMLLISISVVSVAYYTVSMSGFPLRFPPIISNLETDVIQSSICKGKMHCIFNEPGEDDLFIVGDSHLMPLEIPSLKYASTNKLRLNILNQDGCLYVLQLNRVNKVTGKKRGCSYKFQQKRRSILLAAKPSIVIIGGRFPLMLTESRFNNNEGGDEGEMLDYWQHFKKSRSSIADRQGVIINEYKNTIKELTNHGHKVVLIYPVPEVGWNVPERLSRILKGVSYSEIELTLEKNRITTSFEVYKNRAKESFQLLDGIKHENIIRVYPHKLFCNTVVSGRCITHDLNNSFYRDDDHLSAVGASLLMNMIESKLSKVK